MNVLKNKLWEDKDITDTDYNYMLEKLGMKIKLARIEKKISVLELSQISGVSDSYLSRIENGKVKAPGIRLYIRILFSLDINPSEIFSVLDNCPPFDSKKKRKD